MNQRMSSRARRPNLTPALIAASSLMLVAVQSGCAADSAAGSYPSVAVTAPSVVPPAQSPPLTPHQLDQLVAPIALYPDELVAEVLAAATYPTDVVEADRWMQTHASLKGNALADAVNAQPWADSVKALAQFPSVLAMMDQNLSWTTSLGEAYMGASQSVMSAVQQMRARAEQAGNLKSTPQENVTNEGQTIVIEPTSPEVVYLPDYDPWLVYGAPAVFYPGWVAVPGLFIDEPGIVFGFGIGIGAFGGFGWGWDHWRADWHRHDVFFDHHPYVSHRPAFWGHRVPAAFGHPEAFHSGIGFTGGFHAGAFPGAHPGGFAYGGHSFTPGGFNRGAGMARFALHGGGFHGNVGGARVGGHIGGFHGGIGGFHGGHVGGGHR